MEKINNKLPEKKPESKEIDPVILQRLLNLRMPERQSGVEVREDFVYVLYKLLEHPDIPMIISKSPMELRNAHKAILSSPKSSAIEEFRTLFHKHMLEYGIFFSDERESGTYYFTAVERYSDTESIKRYHETIKEGEPRIQGEVKFFRIKAGDEKKLEAAATTLDNILLMNDLAVDNHISSVQQIKWSGIVIPLFSPAQYKNAIITNELSYIAFEPIFKPFVLTLDGQEFRVREISEFYSDIMSLRTDIRDMRRIVLNTMSSSESTPGYDFTHKVVSDYLRKKEIKIGPDNINNLDLYREIQSHMETAWQEILAHLKNSQHRK